MRSRTAARLPVTVGVLAATLMWLPGIGAADTPAASTGPSAGSSTGDARAEAAAWTVRKCGVYRTRAFCEDVRQTYWRWGRQVGPLRYQPTGSTCVPGDPCPAGYYYFYYR